MDIQLLYASNLPLIRERVNSVGYGYADMSELLSLSDAIFMDAISRFDPSRGLKFSTFLYSKLTKELRDFMRRYPRTQEDCEILLEDPRSRHDKRLEFMDALHGMSDEACEVIELVIGIPGEILGTPGSPREARARLRGFLDAGGWSNRRITAAFNEIREVLEES